MGAVFDGSSQPRWSHGSLWLGTPELWGVKWLLWRPACPQVDGLGGDAGFLDLDKTGLRVFFCKKTTEADCDFVLAE